MKSASASKLGEKSSKPFPGIKLNTKDIQPDSDDDTFREKLDDDIKKDATKELNKMAQS